MRVARLLFVFCLTVMLTGCLSSYTLVKVKPDGTGTVEQTTLINPQMVGLMGGVAQSMGAQGQGGAPPKPPTMAELFSEETLRGAASRMGEGVRFVSSTPAKANGREGVTAIYAFEDVTKLSVSQAMRNPSSRQAEEKKSESPIVFALTPQAGGSKLLSITMPEGKAPAGTEPAKPAGAPTTKELPPEALAMVRSMFQDSKIGIDVEVDGRLIKTNSPHVAGSRVTLMEVDLGLLMEDPAKIQQMQQMGPGAGFDSMRTVLDGVKGAKLPAARTTTIEFAGR